eukprot:987-Heterococcus_DN1.PRE.3
MSDVCILQGYIDSVDCCFSGWCLVYTLKSCVSHINVLLFSSQERFDAEGSPAAGGWVARSLEPRMKELVQISLQAAQTSAHYYSDTRDSMYRCAHCCPNTAT